MFTKSSLQTWLHSRTAQSFFKNVNVCAHPQGFCFNWNKVWLIYQLFFYSLLISHLYGIFNCLRFIRCKTVLIGQVFVANRIPHSSAYSAERLRCLCLPWSIFLSLPYSFSQRRQVAASAAAVADHHWKDQRKHWAASWIFFPGKVNLPCFFPFFSTSWKKLFFFFYKKQTELIAEKQKQKVLAQLLSLDKLETPEASRSIVSAFFLLKPLLGRGGAIVMVNFTRRGRKGW